MHGDSPYDPTDGDWQTLVTFFSPTEAFLLRGCLQAGGVPAMVADAHLVQTYSLLAGAVPVRVMVPERLMDQAEKLVDAYQRGDFALPDDEDPPSVDAPTDPDTSNRP
ncbi:DUF2007 domain-containing protein [Hydrogenophaga sp. PAMC20947]|uniref:putative signal transducing protein n=1 Tax=Hydrogenophaga sp. PAMC20947 TaxID=2565558 RepID=UPI00109DC95A|nr:DUF2007 domain-containing protein [Hydrogenophaga sp. PAMC20947]QCB47460.1 DUF2007 domain-containing protein [Hydrogenophaga sp. PAMC20947]